MRGGYAMDNIKVLWMNNGDESLLDYIGEASQNNITFTTCSTVSDCKDLVEHKSKEWDAIMLNADYKWENSKGVKKRSVNIYGNLLSIINIFCLPLFVVTDNERLGSWTIKTFKDYGQPIYLLNDQHLLLGKIIQDESKNPEFKIRKKYSVVCEYCNNPHLMNLLLKLEKGGVDFPKDTTIPNECRDVLEWIKVNSPLNGKVIPYKIMKMIDNDITCPSDFYCDTYDKLTLNEFSRAVDKTNYIPEYVKRSFHRCCSVSNEGSHLSEIDDLIGKNKVPYVNATLIYDLLNVIYWCATIKKS